jgi:hypothetical protein
MIFLPELAYISDIMILADDSDSEIMPHHVSYCANVEGAEMVYNQPKKTV